MSNESELLSRADAHKAFNLTRENTPGSGYHDEDVDPLTIGLPRAAWRKVAPQHNGLPRLSHHVIGFYDHDFEEAVYFVGPDATKVHEALTEWAADHTPKNPHDPMPGTIRKLLRWIPYLRVVDAEGVPLLKLWLTEWNDYLYALGEQGVGVTGAPLEPDGTTP